MSLVFSDLTAADWAEFEQHAPAACAWLRARALEREYARLDGLQERTMWQVRRLDELRRLQPLPHDDAILLPHNGQFLSTRGA